MSGLGRVFKLRFFNINKYDMDINISNKISWRNISFKGN